jgi:SAM-dependent methyltransferase
VQHSEECVEYQKFLVSDQREKLIHPNIYTAALQKDARENLNILDFGCGHGYVAVHLATKPLHGIRVYACDTDEECLDVLWGRIAERQMNNLTAFHMPNYSQISLPGWLPPIDYVFCSFSISALEHPDIGLPHLVTQVPHGTNFIFTEWDPTRSHALVDMFVPQSRRIALGDFKQLLKVSGLEVQHEESGKQAYYLIRATKN